MKLNIQRKKDNLIVMRDDLTVRVIRNPVDHPAAVSSDDEPMRHKLKYNERSGVSLGRCRIRDKYDRNKKRNLHWILQSGDSSIAMSSTSAKKRNREYLCSND